MKTCFYLFIITFLALSASAQSWQKGPSLPATGRDGAICFAIDSVVYFGGGEGKDFWAYNTIGTSWQKRADIPGVTASRGFAVAFSFGGKGYVGLGTDNSTILKDMWQYDPAQNTWSKKADYPGGGRDALLCFMIGSKAYIGGGTDNKFLYNDFYSYDPTADSWKPLGPLPMGAVAFASSFVIGDSAYVTGGDLGSGYGQLSDLYVYDAPSDSWDLRTAFPGAARQTAVSFVLGGKGYIGLGQADYTTVFTDFYSYDHVKDEWTQVTPDFPVSPGRAWASAVAVGGKAYVGGGWDFGNNFYNDWWTFDPTATALVSSAVGSQPNASIVPNPATTSITVQANNGLSLSSIDVVDALGRTLITASAPDLARIDVHSLPTGMYMVRLRASGFEKLLPFVKM